MKCANCGSPLDRDDRCCPYCKTRIEPTDGVPKQEIHIHYHQAEPMVRVEYIETPLEKRSDKSRLLALLLCIFMGIWGAHKFYLGRYGLGILYLLTFGFVGYGWLIDLFILAFGNPKDKDGFRLAWR